MEFDVIKTAVAKQFKRMSKYQLFRTAVEKDAMWDTYLKSFPQGSNPIYKERTEHDCNCCKGFIRAVGNVVAVIDGEVETLWDIKVPEPAYQAVADKLRALVRKQPIAIPFLHFEAVAGTDKSLVKALGEGGEVQSWSHFFINLPKEYTKPGDQIPSILGESRSTFEVFKRSLDTITIESIDTVLDLISQNVLYRGEEHKASVVTFCNLKNIYVDLSDKEKEIFAWINAKDAPGSVAKIRNTAIGTLLVDLSEGVEMEFAVKAFESKVAPTNYKRPKALVTKAMIEKAKKGIEELGLSSALQRRYAFLEDIEIENLLFANRSTKKRIKGDVFEELAQQAGTKGIKSIDKVEDVSINDFIKNILPRAESVEIMVENRHVPNLVSLIAPTDPTAKRLFKWKNQFSWSYNGELADSIKERVKKAGGNVTGDLCCRLAWFNYDDLDFHMVEPGGYHIHFANRHIKSPCGGMLDVDMNAGGGHTREPVENIFYSSRKTMKEGKYHLFVHNYAQRDMSDVGFEVELDWLGNVQTFAYPQGVSNRSEITIADFTYSKEDGVVITKSLPASHSSKQVWGLKTHEFHEVNALMLSPNHWDGNAVGNKHLFFMLEGCRNEGQARGFFNEFLTEELTAHRKVIEVVGAKMKTEESERQLSGLGFSSTQRNTVLCRVKGSFSRVINLSF